MSIFTSKLPEDFLLLVPTGRFPTTTGGYSLYPIENKDGLRWRSLPQKFMNCFWLMENWLISAPWGDFSTFRLVGYSQGAALSYGFMMLIPQQISAVAGFAGFLPIIPANYL